MVELAGDYQRYVKGYYGTGPSSEYHRLQPVLKPLRELYGWTPAVEFGPLQLKALRQKFIGLGWSRSYVNANVKRIVHMFRWAVAEGRLDSSIAQAPAMVPGLRAGKTEARETAPCCRSTRSTASRLT